MGKGDPSKGFERWPELFVQGGDKSVREKFLLFFSLMFISRNVMLVVEEGRNGSCSLGAAIMKQMYENGDTSDLRE